MIQLVVAGCFNHNKKHKMNLYLKIFTNNSSIIFSIKKIYIKPWKNKNNKNREDSIIKESNQVNKLKESKNYPTKMYFLFYHQHAIQYYQMILNNQQNLKNQYVSPFHQRDQVKSKLINKGYEEGKIRNQIEYQREIRRQQNIKKQLKTVLSYQVNEKQINQQKQKEQTIKANEHLRNVLLTPQEIQLLERERKLKQMTKYKQDLDKLTSERLNISRSQTQNPQCSPQKREKHDLLLNPLPYNIQNPYILKEMQRKKMISPNSSFKTISNAEGYSGTRKNIFG